MGADDYSAYAKLRSKLDDVYNHAEKYDDPKKSGCKLPKVVAEIRADCDTEYRVVQEIQQVLSDTIDPNDGMKPKKGATPDTMRPFVNIDFTARKPGEK